MIEQIVLDFFNEIPHCPKELYDESGVFWDYDWQKWHHKVDINCGASKFVVIFKDLDYVIKVPVSHCYNEEYIGEDCWDEELEGGPYDPDADYAQESWMLENGGSRPGDIQCWDYCALEESLSKSAIDEGLEFVVLPTTYLGEVNGYRLYKQPKAEKIWGYRELKTEEEKEKANTYRSKSDGAAKFSSSFVLKFIETFSEEFCEKFFNWIEEEYISDLHGSNLGIRNGHPVVFDYCGYTG